MAGDSVKAQTVLLLHGPRQPYQITNDYDVPLLVEDDETLIKTHTIGLNPIDWKSPYEVQVILLPCAKKKKKKKLGGYQSDKCNRDTEITTLASRHCPISLVGNSPGEWQPFLGETLA